MHLKIKRVDQTMPLPEYKTTGAVAFDLYSRIEIEVPAKEIKLVPLNVIIKVPDGYLGMIAARSSSPIKKGLTAANGVGIIDQDFCGPEDEWHFMAYNFTDKPVMILKGERVAQGLMVKFATAEWDETQTIAEQTRGGFGSTGK